MREIDVLHLGQPRAICCFAVDDAIVDPGPESATARLIDELDGEVPARILLTHIHLDHAGATGALVRRWPDVEVWVHERGARHLVDPSGLLVSAERVFGAETMRQWGEVVPVPERNIRVLEGGEQIGDWRVAYTPGHASHHVCFLHEPSATAFVGDNGGLRIDGSPIIPPTPPPDIDVDAWHASLDRVAEWQPERVALTHFGAFDDAAGHLAAMHERLDHWAAQARALDADAFYDAIVAEMRGAGPEVGKAMLRAMPPDGLWAGLDRYWRTREAGASQA